MKKHDTVNSRLIAILIFALGMFILVLGAICLFAQIRDLGLIVIIMAGGFWFLSWRMTRREKRPWETTNLFYVLITVLLWISLLCVLAHLVFCILAWIHGDGWIDELMMKLGIYGVPYLMESSGFGCIFVFSASLDFYGSARKARRNQHA